VSNQLKKGYIRLSKSSQTLPVFFVSKKDRSKRIVIDYCSLNKQIIKNNYPLKRAKGTISLAQAGDIVPGPNCMLKIL